MDDLVFETRVSGEISILIDAIASRCAPLRDRARVSIGCQAYNSSKHTPQQIKDRVFHVDAPLSSEYLPELAGSDVARYEISRRRGQWIKYGPWLHDHRTMDWLTGPRILVREITGASPYRIHACYTDETYCNYKTILHVNPDDSTEENMRYLCGLLNSRLISFVFPLIANKMLAHGFPRISVGDLRRLPIRPIDFSNPHDVAKHDRMVALVQDMLDLHKRLPEAQNPTDRAVIERRIQATDDQIDALVYELYGLTDDEIALVEASTS